jgi:hypothetical protein
MNKNYNRINTIKLKSIIILIAMEKIKFNKILANYKT